MKIKNFFFFSIAIAFVLIVCIDISLLVFMQVTSLTINYKAISVLSFFLFVLLAIIINSGVETYINFRINKIYKQVSTLKKKRIANINVNADEFDFLARDILKYTYKKKREISKLNYRENYRRDFLGNVAHELKTPLFTVQGYLLTLIEGAAENREIRDKYLKRANNAIERLSEIVGDLDLITKLETNDLKLNIDTFNIIKVIQKVFDLLEMQAKKRNIKLTLNKFYDIPEFVFADEAKIEQVLINLVMNSIKYGKIGGTTIVSVDYVDDEKIVVKVSDNGEGISNTDLPRVFERFYRVDKSRSRDQGGSGLGLSIVKHIIEAHEQTIDVKSIVGKGSTFYFTLEKS
ncbi:cell wall metabolism sensor histidine kinase WalK [Wenyingzhuangia sp. 2_MG-2023]|uniref:sensor histidine kinase n=1 Tax=Wenyingzhuangia sp. 2_MG-2023 TaxID=3062639 RepID=UPI0026E1A750|nr:ATP-binding protein [Wenyingzhuangia sp. 2_MG-2023]MDO6736559.1 ATP-binding protein [Wenyingzhuangia sp. 2_MG-2023]MDO6801146.1 ATP-binding protein [Wenyingzhuangia sp. 1_MG-2023]